jgi:hypothetical protein
MTAHGLEDFTRLRIPQSDRLVITRRCNAGTVRTDREAQHVSFMPLKDAEFLSGRCIPQSDRPVAACGNHPLSVGSKCDFVHVAGVPVTRDVAALKTSLAIVPLEVITVLPRDLV